jgi:hypothetical protein
MSDLQAAAMRWACGAAEAPPRDTLYFPTQIVIRR